jgi:hypothetical protein
VLQVSLQAREVGWLPLSRMRDHPWPRTPRGKWRLRAMSKAATPLLAVPRRPASYPTMTVVYHSSPTTTDPQPTPATSTVVMSMPHHAWGFAGLGVLPVGVRLALSRR